MCCADLGLLVCFHEGIISYSAILCDVRRVESYVIKKGKWITILGDLGWRDVKQGINDLRCGLAQM